MSVSGFFLGKLVCKYTNPMDPSWSRILMIHFNQLIPHQLIQVWPVQQVVAADESWLRLDFRRSSSDHFTPWLF